VITLHCLKS